MPKWEVGKEYTARGATHPFKVVHVKNSGNLICVSTYDDRTQEFYPNGQSFGNPHFLLLPPEPVKRSEWALCRFLSNSISSGLFQKEKPVHLIKDYKHLHCLRYDYEDDVLVAVSLEKE